MSLDECETLADVTAFYRRERAEQERMSRLKVNRPRCGSRTRAGGECAAPAVWDAKAGKPVNGRCRMHGGLSTGPRSTEGRARALANLRRGPISVIHDILILELQK
jgi:hypothetical protein